MKSQGTPLSTLAKCWTRFPQLVTNIRVREKRPFDQLNHVLSLVSDAEVALKPEGGRVLLRYSGTEPKARLLLEGPNAAALEIWSHKIAAAIKEQVGA
jgi:phosphoglucosamine mutase